MDKRHIYQALGWLRERSRSGSVFMFGGLMLANMIAYVYHMIVARMMQPAEYGTLVTLLSVSYVLTVAMRAFQAWVIKAASAPGGRGRVRAVFVGALQTLVPLGVLVLALHWLVGRQVAGFLRIESAAPVIMLGLYAFTSFIVPVPRGLLLGINRLHFTGITYLIDPLVRIVVATALLMAGLGVEGALAGFSAGNIISFVVGVVALWPLLRATESQTALTEPPARLDRYALASLAINTFLAIMVSIDQIAVKHFFSDQIAGNYAVAYLLGQVITMSTISLGWVVFARAARMAPDDPQQTRVLIRGLMVIGVIAGGLMISYLALPHLAIQLMGGAQYTSAHNYVGLIGIETTLFAFIYIQAYYHMSMRRLEVIWPLAIAVVIQIGLLLRFHESVEQILVSLIAVLFGLLCWISLFSWRTLQGVPSLTQSRQVPFR